MSDKPHQAFEDEYDPSIDEAECWNCGGEGYVYCCFEEFACIDPESGCDECMRRCDVCNRRAPNSAEKSE